MAQQKELDMENRDPNNINEHIQVRFEDIIGEPEGVHSLDCVWKCAFCCFSCMFKCCYTCLTCFCACPMACSWALQFACLACYHIWCFMPCLRHLTMEAAVVRKCYYLTCDTFFGPAFETCGLLFSKIKVSSG